jgi:hypothetical protein
VLEFAGLNDRHVVCEPRERDIGLNAAQRLGVAIATSICPAMPVAAVSTRCAPARSPRWRMASNRLLIIASNELSVWRRPEKALRTDCAGSNAAPAGPPGAAILEKP